MPHAATHRADTTPEWRPLRIAMLGTRGVPATYGGIEHHVEEVGSRLAERGHEVTVFCRPGYTVPAEEHRGMQLRSLPTIGTKHLEALVHTAAGTLASLRGFDVAHYHGVGPGALAVVPRTLHTSGVVLTVHSLSHEDRSKWGPTARRALRGAVWLSRHAAHEVVTVSSALNRRFESDGHPSEYVPNAARTMVARPPRLITERFGLHGGDYLLALGRFVPEKGFDVLLDAFGLMDAPVRLVIAGGGSHSSSHVALVERLAALDDRVLLPGYVYGELHEELLANALAFVAPSRSEGLPLTLLEAIAMGTPVVASDIPVHLEVLGGDGPGHRIVPTEDIGSLAAAMAHSLAHTPAERAGLAALRPSVLARYSWDDSVDRLEAVYLRAADRAGRLAVAR